MINEILTFYTGKLENFLENMFHQPEGIVKLSGFMEGDKEEMLNRMVVSVVSVERETATGISSGGRRNATGGFSRGFPPVNMNVNVVFAAVYDQKRYSDSLSVLSAVILFIQANPFFIVDRQRYTVEILTLASEELNNIWSCLGGCYYPSVVCKIRGLVFDAGEIRGTSGKTGRTDTGAEKK